MCVHILHGEGSQVENLSYFPAREGVTHMVNDINLIQLILGKDKPLTFHLCVCIPLSVETEWSSVCFGNFYF